MSEQESTISTESESEEDVELHGKKSVMASDEPRDEADSDDDVELHGKYRNKTA